MFIFGIIKKNFKKVCVLDVENLWVQFVFGSNDYYILVKYGGGKEVEKYLLKVISLFVQRNFNEMFLFWGM